MSRRTQDDRAADRAAKAERAGYIEREAIRLFHADVAEWERRQERQDTAGEPYDLRNDR